MTLGLALIVRDEQDHLPRLLESIQGAFDQVVLLDTGSKDSTVQVFKDWANAQDWPDHGFHPWKVGTFEWDDDFAAARICAHSMLDTTWEAWADADDTIPGAQNLRQLADQAPDEVVALVAGYNYAQDQHGNNVCYLKRERLVRRGAGQWTGRVHEAQVFDGPVQAITPDVAEWVHHKQALPPKKSAQNRNLRILRKWNKAEPNNPRVLAYLGTEEASVGRHKRAVGYFRSYLKLKTGWDQERCQVHRKLSASLLTLGRIPEARKSALEALGVGPTWPDNYLTLAQCCYQSGEYAKAIDWAGRVLELGHPDTLLIVNPLDYTFQPLVLLAASHGALGHVDDAIRYGEKALAIMPDHAELSRNYLGWRSAAKREHTAATFAGAAQLLVAHDEQEKALALLENCVPHFAVEHQQVVALRSQVRERLLWLRDPDAYARHYRDGGSKPEDFIADDLVDAIGDSLPRCWFLREGLLEQVREAYA